MHDEVIAVWVFEHYLMYLYLAIADADCLINKEKLEYIKKKVLKNINGERCAKLQQEVFKEFRENSESERKNYIKNNVTKYLRTDSIKKKVVQELSDILPTDEKSIEHVMFRYIRKIIATS